MYTLKKSLGQHFLKDETVCIRIIESLNAHQYSQLLEVGPGGGALTKYLKGLEGVDLKLVEIDAEKVAFLLKAYPHVRGRIIEADILQIDAPFIGRFTLIGNFPYNISTQIVFKVIEWRDQVETMIGMFQKEVAVRICSGPGSKEYGIISVLLQTFYDIHYCFTVDEHVFIPPPKVKSGVIRCVRNERDALPCDEKLYFQVVKVAFNQRRKTLRNSLRVLLKDAPLPAKFEQQRPERLSVEDFIELTLFIEQLAANKD
jgi:16S rRNA (adenine1518-N6/adenine1519-N6)-dimethyltransferase